MDINILIHTEHFLLEPQNVGQPVYALLPYKIWASNDHAKKEEKFYSDAIKAYIGRNISMKESDFGYKIIEVKEKVETSKFMKMINEQLNYATIYFEEFLNYLWFAKDHSASTTLSIGFLSKNDKPIIGLHNARATSMADGSRTDVAFSREDFIIATKIIQRVSEIYPIKSIENVVTQVELDEENITKSRTVKTFDDHTHYFEFNRIQRAMSLLSILRSVSFLPYKLSMYIPILESLFSPSDGELSFRVSQRVAFYIGDDKEEVKMIFDQVKRAYDIRSKFLHGQFFPKKTTKLNFKDESKSMDNILRRVLKKVILSDSDIFLSTDIEKELNDLVYRFR